MLDLLTTFHFLENQIKIIVIFKKINDAENIFTTTTMIINIDFFEDTRSIWMTSFTNNLKENVNDQSILLSKHVRMKADMSTYYLYLLLRDH